jgi:hypothetical protein
MLVVLFSYHTCPLFVRARIYLALKLGDVERERRCVILSFDMELLVNLDREEVLVVESLKNRMQVTSAQTEGYPSGGLHRKCFWIPTVFDLRLKVLVVRRISRHSGD